MEPSRHHWRPPGSGSHHPSSVSTASARRCDPQPVTVQIAKFHRAPIRLLPDRLAEPGHDRVDVTDCQVDQGVRASIAVVLGKVQPRPATCDRHERGAAGLEAMLPLLGETQALIPADRCRSVCDAQNRDDFLVHADMVTRSYPAGPGWLSGRRPAAWTAAQVR